MMTVQALDACLASATAVLESVQSGKDVLIHPITAIQTIAVLQQAAALTQLVDVLTDISQELVTLRQLVEEVTAEDADGRKRLAVMLFK
jgi:hypothetical protein